MLSSVPETPSNDASPLITGNTGEARPVHRYAIEFTGSGSEYFRIWIVNLLLTLVTLGLYYPWAKVRRLKYFYGNTRVAGHALDFHGDPKRMLRGFLLMAGLFMLYNAASYASPAAGGLAALVFMGIWPALLRASWQFRLANTSWRGLRFQFTGSLKDSYLTFLVPVLAMVGLFVASAVLMAVHPALGIIPLLAIYAVVPYMFYRLKAYQHRHYAYAQLQSEFRASFGDVGKVFLKTAGLLMLMALVGGALVGLLIGLGTLSAPGQAGGSMKALFAMLPVLVVFFFVMQIVPLPYFQSRMQNLLWTQTGNRDVRFKSQLDFTPLLKQTLLNWVLIILTLGLYWPFAAVAMARLKLQAVSVHMRADVNQLVGRQQAVRREGIGDAAADLAGIDLGL